MKRVYLFITIFLFVTGCSYATGSPEIETGLPLLTKTSVSSLVATPLPSQTPIPAQIPSINSSTLTPLPRLSPDGSVNVLFELLENNGDCQLPCLLGFTPGISTLEELENFFGQFVSIDSSEILIDRVADNDGKWSALGFYFLNSDVYFDIGLTYYQDETLTKAMVLDSASRQKWHPAYRDTMSHFMLQNILADFGVPSQVMILTYPYDPQRSNIVSWPFFLFVLYQERGFYVLYEMNRMSTGAEFRGCPAESFVSIATWSPRDNETFKTLTEATVLGNYLSDYKSIDDSTAMDLDEFFQVFSNPNNVLCIDTPIDAWPKP